MKGTKSRAGGGVKPGFEGGQSPLWRRTPKLGYMPKTLARELEVLNLEKLQRWVDTGRIDTSAPITMRTLLRTGLVSNVRDGVKLLGKGADRFTAKINVEVAQASESAIKAIEAAGGTIKSVYYSPLALRSLLQPEKFELPIKSPRPPPKLLEYYSSYKNRGYLSPELQLQELKGRVASVQPGDQAAYEQAAQLMPVFVGGPIERAAAAGIAPAGAGAAVAAAPASGADSATK